jgi:hypothetical protein
MPGISSNSTSTHPSQESELSSTFLLTQQRKSDHVRVKPFGALQIGYRQTHTANMSGVRKPVGGAGMPMLEELLINRSQSIWSVTPVLTQLAL